jgi:hypothetical protein
MLTIVETPLFRQRVSDYWTENERGEFFSWLAQHPDSGDIVPGSGGCRKVRWKRQGSGKSGGVRVIYYNRLANGEIWLLTIYAKSVQENIPAHTLKAIKEAIDHAED